MLSIRSWHPNSLDEKHRSSESPESLIGELQAGGEKAYFIRLDLCNSSVERGERDVEVSILNDNDVMFVIKFK